MAIRNIRKNLAGMEDLLQGVGTEEQVRGDSAYSIGKIDVPYAVETVEAMQALDVALFTRARVYESTLTYTDYIYDPDDTTGILPNEGAGSWRLAPVTQVFETVAQLKLAGFAVGSLVQTKGYAVAGDGGGATYLIAASQTVDGYGDHALANGNVALLQKDRSLNLLQYGVTPSGDSSAQVQAAVDYAEANDIRRLIVPPCSFSGITQTKQLRWSGMVSAGTKVKNAVAGGDMLTISYSGVSDVDKRNMLIFEDINFEDEASETGRSIVTSSVFFMEFNRCYWQNFSTVRAVDITDTLWCVFNYCSTDRAEIKLFSNTDPHFNNLIQINGGEYRNPTTRAFDIEGGDCLILNGPTIEGDSGNTTTPLRACRFVSLQMVKILGSYMEFVRTGDAGMKFDLCDRVEIEEGLFGTGGTNPALWFNQCSQVRIKKSQLSSTVYLKTTNATVLVEDCGIFGKAEIAEDDDVRFIRPKPLNTVMGIAIDPIYQNVLEQDTASGSEGRLYKNAYASSSFDNRDPTVDISGSSTATTSYNQTEGYLDNNSLQIDFTGIQNAIFLNMGTTDAANQGAIITFMAKSNISAEYNFQGSIGTALGTAVMEVTTKWKRYFVFTQLSAVGPGSGINLIITSTETSQLLIDDIQTVAYTTFIDAADAFASFRHIQTTNGVKALESKSARVANFLTIPQEKQVTISGGIIRADSGALLVDTEASAATDNLDTINGVPNNGLVFIRAVDSSRTVVLRHGVGNLFLDGGTNKTLDSTFDEIVLKADGANLRQIAFSSNGV